MGILTQDMQRVAREQRLGYIATVCPDQTPNLSPKGTTTVWDDDHLVFADVCSPGTIANLRHNPAIEINVVDPIARKGYRFKGTAVVLEEGPEFERIMGFYLNTYKLNPNIAERVRHVVLIQVARALPLVSPVYDLGSTEDEIVRRYTDYYVNLKRPQRATASEPAG